MISALEATWFTQSMYMKQKVTKTNLAKDVFMELLKEPKLFCTESLTAAGFLKKQPEASEGHQYEQELDMTALHAALHSPNFKNKVEHKSVLKLYPSRPYRSSGMRLADYFIRYILTTPSRGLVRGILDMCDQLDINISVFFVICVSLSSLKFASDCCTRFKKVDRTEFNDSVEFAIDVHGTAGQWSRDVLHRLLGIPFQYALHTKNDAALLYLLSVNCTPDGYGSCTDLESIWNRDFREVYGIDFPKLTPLCSAIERNSKPLIQILLNMGYKPSGEEKEKAAKVHDQPDFIEMVSRPPSLQACAFATIRTTLHLRGKYLHQFEDAVNIPNLYKKVVMFSDVKQLLKDGKATLFDGETFKIDQDGQVRSIGDDKSVDDDESISDDSDDDESDSDSSDVESNGDIYDGVESDSDSNGGDDDDESDYVALIHSAY